MCSRVTSHRASVTDRGQSERFWTKSLAANQNELRNISMYTVVTALLGIKKIFCFCVVVF